MPDSSTVDFAAARARLIASLQRQVKDARVLGAMARVPRELFVPLDARLLSYEDRPLPIGMQQTISQPFMIAVMTSALRLTGREKVLEVGTGSGYQTAILAELARRVVSVERLLELAERARGVLATRGYSNVEVHQAGATLGWPQGAPYEAILVTAGGASRAREPAAAARHLRSDDHPRGVSLRAGVAQGHQAVSNPGHGKARWLPFRAAYRAGGVAGELSFYERSFPCPMRGDHSQRE